MVIYDFIWINKCASCQARKSLALLPCGKRSIGTGYEQCLFVSRKSAVLIHSSWLCSTLFGTLLSDDEMPRFLLRISVQCQVCVLLFVLATWLLLFSIRSAAILPYLAFGSTERAFSLLEGEFLKGNELTTDVIPLCMHFSDLVCTESTTRLSYF